MDSLINAIRQIVGPAEFYADGVWNFSSMIEYLVASLVLLVVVSSVFKILVRCFDR